MVPGIRIADEVPDLLDIGSFRAIAVMFEAADVAYAIEKLGLGRLRFLHREEIGMNA
jgi:hypothetical protein